MRRLILWLLCVTPLVPACFRECPNPKPSDTEDTTGGTEQ